MKLYIFSLFLVLTLFQAMAIAQEKPAAYVEYEGYNFWEKQEGDTAYVFADVAYIRDYPGTHAVLLDSLTHGSRVRITSNGYNPTVVRGFEAPWHAIEYIKDGQKKKGFIWLGLLALGHHVDAVNHLFIHGLLRSEESTSYREAQYIGEVKCLDASQILLAREQYPVSRFGQTYVESKLLPNMGLEGLQHIYRIGFHGEACGVPTTHYYVGWNGESFVYMFTKSSVSDAGVSYYQENILFPSEHGLDDTLIIKDIVEGEVIDYEAEELKSKETKRREKYRWNGSYISQIMELQ